MNVVPIAPAAEPLEVKVHGSRELRRTLSVERARTGYISVSVYPQHSHRKRGDNHAGWHASLAHTSFKPSRDGEVEIVFHRVGSVALWVGWTSFPLLASEAEELAAKFGFTVRRESQS